MDFLTLAKERYSCRKFKEDKVPEEIVKKIIEAGYVAPTACNNQPIVIKAVTSEEGLEKIRKSTKCHFNAPLCFIILADHEMTWKRPYDKKDSGDVDASIVTTHMMLEAASLGIGSTWVMFFNPDACKNEFNLPDHLEPIAYLPMGYPAEDAVPSDNHTNFRPYDEMVEFL